MRLISIALMNLVSTLLLVGTAHAFLPSAQRPISICNLQHSKTSLSLAIDPSHFVDAIQQFTSATSMLLSDAVDTETIAGAAAAVSDTANSIGSAAAAVVVDTATAVADTATAVADTASAAADAPPDYGWFGFLTVPIEGLLQIIHSLIAGTGTANAWGVSIIALTLLIKVVTFPLTKTQLESTNKMQAMQPAIKEIQLKYQSNPEVMNQKIAEFYQVNEINPLAGCLPSLVQIPVFIGLYRAVLELAKQNKLNEQFLFLPNLEGPTYGADPATASDWILKGWYVDCYRVVFSFCSSSPSSFLTWEFLNLLGSTVRHP
jgi:YidC/Oxa1 family membrane protein insertase